MVEGTACHSQGWVIKDIVAFVLLFWITLSQVSQLLYYEDMKAAFWSGPHDEEPRSLSNSHLSRSFSPEQAFRCL